MRGSRWELKTCLLILTRRLRSASFGCHGVQTFDITLDLVLGQIACILAAAALFCFHLSKLLGPNLGTHPISKHGKPLVCRLSDVSAITEMGDNRHS